MEDEFTKHRHELEERLLDAAAALLKYTMAESALIPIPGSDPPTYIAVGQPETMVDDMMLKGSLR